MYSFNFPGNLTIKLLLKNCGLATALISNHTPVTQSCLFTMQKKFFSIVIIDLPSLFLSTGGRVIHVSDIFNYLMCTDYCAHPVQVVHGLTVVSNIVPTVSPPPKCQLPPLSPGK